MSVPGMREPEILPGYEGIPRGSEKPPGMTGHYEAVADVTRFGDRDFSREEGALTGMCGLRKDKRGRECDITWKGCAVWFVGVYVQ